MGKAVGGGVYSVQTDLSKSTDPKINRIKVDLESIEFEGDMNETDWVALKGELLKLDKKYGKGKVRVTTKARASKP